jgi:hypothetical protein
MENVPNLRSTDREIMIDYIQQHVNNLTTSERQDILQMMINSPIIKDSKIHTKGDGSQIKYKHIPDSILSAIHSYVRKHIDDKRSAIEHFSDNDGSDIDE